MSASINGTTIILTRGDTLKTTVELFDSSGEKYIPTEDDEMRFAAKYKYDDQETVILIDIPTDTCLLHIRPEDTKHLEFGKYVYDIQITMSDGTVDTFIIGMLKITEEVC